MRAERRLRRAFAAIALAAALAVLAGCGQQPPLAALPPFPTVGPGAGAGWQLISGDLAPHLDSRSPDVCTEGTPSCMDAVVGEMTRRLNALGATCDHLAPFALMYRAVSREVQTSVRTKRYRNPAYVAHLDAVFATLYFHAIDQWRLGHHAKVPGAWQLAFRAGQSKRTSTLGDMLLGMNAHISRDLPYALAAVGLRYPDGGDATGDVVRVNGDIRRAQAPMLRDIARRFDSEIYKVARASRWIPPGLIARVISRWRLEALENARRLLAAHSPAERERAETTIDDNATIRGLLIWRSTLLPPAGQARRDRYCADHAGRASGSL